MAAKIKEGSLLAIPVSEEKFALAHVYRSGVTFYLIIYDKLRASSDLNVDQLGRVVLASWTNDAEIYRGRWILIGDTPLEVLVPEPEYKVLVAGNEMVESFDGKARRVATTKDRSLTSRKSRSPLILEDAVRAFHGLGRWSPSCDEMLVAPVT